MDVCVIYVRVCRTPSASREPLPRLRYSSPVGASPSRSLESRPHEPEHLEHSVPCYNGKWRRALYTGSGGRGGGGAILIH